MNAHLTTAHLAMTVESQPVMHMTISNYSTGHVISPQSLISHTQPNAITLSHDNGLLVNEETITTEEDFVSTINGIWST